MFNVGDVVYHKATSKRCVVLAVNGNIILVRTEDDAKRNYQAEELRLEEK